MGHEVNALVRIGAASAEAKVTFEADHARIGKPFSRRLTREEVMAFKAEGDHLVTACAEGEVRLSLAPGVADRILKRLRTPRSRADKLGLRPGQAAHLIGLDDADLRADCDAAGVSVTRHPAPMRQDTALVFLAADSPAELERFGSAAMMAPAAAIWVVSHKGKTLTLRDVDVMTFAGSCGYVSTKVVAYDTERTALRFVRRKAAHGVSTSAAGGA